jgi:hypothetical protein
MQSRQVPLPEARSLQEGRLEVERSLPLVQALRRRFPTAFARQP